MTNDSGFRTLRSIHPVEQLERVLLRKILSGEIRVGDLLPSIPRLAQACGVARNTVVAALGSLSARGLLTSRTGKRAEVISNVCAEEILREQLNRELSALRSLVSDVEALLAALDAGPANPAPD